MPFTQNYVKQVIDVMHQAEDLEDIKELHACCACMQAICELVCFSVSLLLILAFSVD